MEALEVDDLYTSPVPPKIMSTLRHTKSEEKLCVDTESLPPSFTFCGNICDDNDPDWSQEDDEISRQVCCCKKRIEVTILNNIFFSTIN